MFPEPACVLCWKNLCCGVRSLWPRFPRTCRYELEFLHWHYTPPVYFKVMQIVDVTAQCMKMKYVNIFCFVDCANNHVGRVLWLWSTVSVLERVIFEFNGLCEMCDAFRTLSDTKTVLHHAAIC